MDRYLLFDLGASNGRAIVATVDNRKVDFEVIHRFENTPVFANDNEYFWDILYLLSEIKKGIQKCYQQYGKVNSMAIDSWGCDFGFLDKHGRLIGNPLTYRDSNQYKYEGDLHKILSKEDLFALSGTPYNVIMGLYKLFSLKTIDATEYNAGDYLLMIPDILNYMLTGKPSNEYTNATMTAMVNPHTRQWEPKIMESLGLRTDFLHKISEPGTVLGDLTPAVCEELGVEPIPVVIPATHDTASAVSGVPLQESDKKWAFISLGTWALAGIETDEPLIDSRIVDFEFGNEGGVGGKNMLLKNINGMWVIQKCRERWLKDGDISWDEIVVEAQNAKEQNCFIDVNEAIFNEYHPDMPQVIRDYCKETGQEIPETIGEVANCAYKSLALMFRYSFDQITEILGYDLELMHLVGGGTQNKLLCQYVSNVMGLKSVAGPTETTAFGNMLFQMIADKKISTIEEGRKLCADNSDLATYMPAENEKWDKTYAAYKAFMDERRK